MKKLLLVFAHPDDESFATGGTIAKYAKAGWQVDLLCATRGQAGSSGPYEGVSGEALGAIRQKELEAAAKILGIAHITWLDYKDGRLAALNPGELEDLISRHMELVMPDVVITFDPNGISNHPDHMKICLSTTYAFQKYAAWLPTMYVATKIYKVHSEEWLKRLEKLRTIAMEPTLYYVCMPESIATYAKKHKMLPSQSFGKPWRGTPDKMVTTVIDVKAQATTKRAALQEHKTQTADVERFADFEHNPIFVREYFIQRFQGLHEVFMGKHDRVSNQL